MTSLVQCLLYISVVLFHHVETNAFIESKGSPQCGYESCSKIRLDALNVHLVPHSHDDVGWLKTVDQYFYGTKTNYQRADVNAIITSVVKALKENPERRFIQVETAFFHKWWQLQTNATKQEVHKLVENGQLEFTGGAWSMNDEAAVHYQSIIDQFTFGLKFLNDTFGECGRPRIGWQIDPFGHSSEMASIYAQMGYDGLFFARLDWRDKSARLNEKRAEMIWRGSNSLANASEIFTSVLYNHYSAPQGFCFDVLCHEDTIVADKASPEYNFKEKVNNFHSFITNQAKHYKTNNIIITMGDDFNYQDAISYFRNMDLLIEGCKTWPKYFRNQEINVFYSTPACYVKAVNEAVNSNKIDLPLETHDFFPYASDYNAYWSGYYTSRPSSKSTVKRANNFLQIHKQVAAFRKATHPAELFKMQNAVGIMQHHDAITGTEKEHVANDYARILDEAFEDSRNKISNHISKLISADLGNPIQMNLGHCLLMNMTICPGSQSDAFAVVIYNPGGSKIRFPVRIAVDMTDFEITDPNDEPIEYQVSPSIAYATKRHGRDNHELENSKYELTFIAHMPPLGIKVFHVKKSSKVKHSIKDDNSRRKYKLGGERTNITINPSTGLLDSVVINYIELSVQQELLYYLSAQGDNSVFEKRASGAYIFRSRYNAVQINQHPLKVTTYKGNLYDEVHQEFASWAKQIIRVYKDIEVAESVEFEWLVGPIPVEDIQGKEVISRFTSELASWDDFYTDSNGREMLHRIRDHRPTYNYTGEEPIAGNYYPVTSQLTITNGDVRMSLLNDRAQGGTSLKSGQVELMVHRRMLYDDAFGVGEALNEREHGEGVVVRGRHHLTLARTDKKVVERRVGDHITNEPWVFIDNTTMFEIAKDYLKREFSGFRPNRYLPESVRILTLEPIAERENVLLLRLENFFDSNTEKVETVNLEGLFEIFDISSLQESHLGANALKTDIKRMRWSQYPNTETSESTGNPLEITLKPMEIKTFIIHVKYI